MLIDLEHLLKVMFYKHPKLSESGEKLIKTLLQAKQKEFIKLGIFSLYCMALALPEK